MPREDESQNIKITKLEGIMEQLKEGFQEIKAEFKDFGNKNDAAHRDITDKIDKFIDSADAKYAPKSVVWWIFITIGGLAITEIVRSMLK